MSGRFALTSGRLGPLSPSFVIVLHLPSAACSALNLRKAAGDRSGADWSAVGHLQGKDTHILMDWAQSREKVEDKRILPRERGITMGPEVDSSSPGTTLALGHVGLAPLAAPQGTFPTMKEGKEATDQLSATLLGI